MAFCIGTIALSIAIFFVEIYNPWPYFWACAGVIMRMVVLSRAQQAVPVRKARIKVEEPPVDRFGWSAAPVTRGAATVRRTSI
jgi:hypothetical protein